MKLSKYRIQNNLIFIDYINLITVQNAKFYSNQMKIFVQFNSFQNNFDPLNLCVILKKFKKNKYILTHK